MDIKKVLVLNSYDENDVWESGIERGFRETVSSFNGITLEID